MSSTYRITKDKLKKALQVTKVKLKEAINIVKPI